MPEYAQIDLFVYKAKIFRNRFVTIGWFNQINYMRDRRQGWILLKIESDPAGDLFLFLPAELSNIKKQFESLTCIKGEDTHIADFPFSGKAKKPAGATIMTCRFSDHTTVIKFAAGKAIPMLLTTRRRRQLISDASPPEAGSPAAVLMPGLPFIRSSDLY